MAGRWRSLRGAISGTPTQRESGKACPTAALTRGLEEHPVTEPFKILALDGGGLRGIFTAAVLAEAARVFGPAFLQSVDLIVGTSTGGIIALGLAAGKAPSELLGFYQNAGPRIFGHPRKVAQLWSPKYDRGPLDDVLKREFGESMKMNDLTKPVCISALRTRAWHDSGVEGRSPPRPELWRRTVGLEGGCGDIRSTDILRACSATRYGQPRRRRSLEQ